MRILKRALTILIWVFKPPQQDITGAVSKVISWSMTARKEGLLGLETLVDAETEYFTQRAEAAGRWYRAGCDQAYYGG